MVLKFNVRVDALVLLLKELLKLNIAMVKEMLVDWRLLPVHVPQPLTLMLPIRY
jgi:hypothetical protein